MQIKKQTLIPVLFIAITITVAGILYARFADAIVAYMSRYNISYESYVAPRDLVVQDVSALSPAESIPVLMYHGVTARRDTVNTTQKNFVAQMEALKRAGYQTITVDEMYRFRQGAFILPPKPILITFDDGRKDSYYTTDAVLKGLGFKATMFVATGPMITGNDFYLTQAELKKIAQDPTWELEAHGRHSHNRILINEHSHIDDADTVGRFLSSKIYNPDTGTLETEADFASRVRSDYEAGNLDLEAITGRYPQYIAIPLNDYGQTPMTNFPESGFINNAIVKTMYKLAFIQANNTDDVTSVVFSPYNFAFEDAHSVRRLEVKNMKAEQLLGILESYAPRPVAFVLDQEARTTVHRHAISGDFVVDASGDATLASVEVNGIGQFAVGQPFWKEYRTTLEFAPKTTQSVGIIVSSKNKDNYILCGFTDDAMYIRQTIQGKKRDLVYPTVVHVSQQETSIEATVENQRIICRVGESVLEAYVDTPLFGQTGVKIWDSQEKASIDIFDFRVESL
jgi:peptidoglycan/xylan/chitin deacetylase (PgdA/CDA1 family)